MTAGHIWEQSSASTRQALRRRIMARGGELLFGCRVDDLDIRGGRLVGLHTSTGYVPGSVVFLAIGHSAHDTYAMLLQRGVPMAPKPFQMGVRIEQPQTQVTRVQYGSGPQVQSLGPADYSMAVTVAGQRLFTFCMCAGGYVIPSVAQPGHFCTNGMSRSSHDSPFANSGLMITVDPAQLPGADRTSSALSPLCGTQYQSALEQKAFGMAGSNYDTPIQWARDFLRQRQTIGLPPTSYSRGACSVNFWELLPVRIAELLQQGLQKMDERWHGLFLRNATLLGPETRGSCPLRIVRDQSHRQSIGVAGLYPVGEGAGYAGGIVSAAVDGLRSAKAVISTYAPLSR